MAQDKLRELEEYFYTADKELRERGLYNEHTQAGFFFPASLWVVSRGLDTLLDAGYISTDSSLLEAGTGDGRVVALGSYVYGFDTVGFEYDERLVRFSLQFLADSPFQLGNYRIIQGDFLSDRDYERAGYRFSDFGIVFHYENNPEFLAEKISAEAPDTQFILISNTLSEEYYGLTLQYKVRLSDQRMKHDHPAKEMYMCGMDMGLYEKEG